MSEAPAEFHQMVDAAVLRLVGLPDDQVADVMITIAAAYEEAMRKVAPQLSDADMQTLRDLFIANVGCRLDELSVLVPTPDHR